MVDVQPRKVRGGRAHAFLRSLVGEYPSSFVDLTLEGL